MSKIKYLFFYTFFLLVFVMSDRLAATATVEGTITDAVTGLPIQGALVELIRGGQVRYSDITDVNGFYQIANVEPSNYTMVVSASGYQTQSIGGKLDNNTTTTFNLSLVPNGGIIVGTVTDANTTSPISGASVKLFNGTILLATTSTDGSGNYSFPELAPGGYVVVASASGYAASVKGGIVTIGNTTTVNFALDTQQGSIAGTVTDAITTNPIQGAIITILSGATIIDSVDTDVNGNYNVSGLAPGNYRIIANADNYQIQSEGATVTSGGTTIIDFALIPNPGSITGTVTRADTGMPIAGATVSVFQQFDFIGSVVTSPDGTYNFSNLGPGNYIVSANAAGFQIQFKGSTVIANTTLIVNFALNPNPGIIVGMVVDANTNIPIFGATIRVLDGPLVIATTVTDSNGNYIVQNLEPSDYTVLAGASGYQSKISAATVNPSAPTVVNFSLNPFPGTILGTVTDASTTDPIPGATVVVFQGITPVAFAQTDANGNYSIANLASGNYTIVVRAPGYQIAYTSALVVANTITIANFSLNGNPGAISGAVTDRCSEKGISGALVIVTDGTTIVSFGITDMNGQYTIDSLAPGNYTVAVAKRNDAPATSSISVTAGNTSILNFVLSSKVSPPSNITGKAFYNEFLTQKERVHYIQWTASSSGCVIEYQVFRNGILVKIVPASAPLEFSDHNRNKKKDDIYAVRAVNSFGETSDFVTIALK